MTAERMETKNKRKQRIVSTAQTRRTEATDSTSSQDKLEYALVLATTIIGNTTFKLTELGNIRVDQSNPQDYSVLAAQRFRYGGSAALTVNASRQYERSVGPLSEVEKAKLYNRVRTGLRLEYIDAISTALTERHFR